MSSFIWLLVFFGGAYILMFVIYLLPDGPSKKKLKKQWAERNKYERLMWANYSHLCETWTPLLEKWSNLPIQNGGQIPEDPVPFLADFKSRCALKVARGHCNCHKNCPSCGQMHSNISCFFQCQNSCLACVHFRKYANCYVQLNEYQQLEIDQLASEYFRQFVAHGTLPGSNL